MNETKQLEEMPVQSMSPIYTVGLDAGGWNVSDQSYVLYAGCSRMEADRLKNQLCNLYLERLEVHKWAKRCRDLSLALEQIANNAQARVWNMGDSDQASLEAFNDIHNQARAAIAKAKGTP